MKIGTRLFVGWDDPPTAATGTLVGQIDDPGRPGVESPLVELNDELTAEGQIVGSGLRGMATGRFIVLSARYVGHDWDSGEGIVHVTLFDEDPRGSATRALWVADHGVYRTITAARD